MSDTTKPLCKFVRDRQGVSNVIVMVLSLVILVVIASNVVLWSYEMNQLDWERTQETLSITSVAEVNATLSQWFKAQAEFQLNNGSRLSGTYLDTYQIDGQSETLQEESRPPNYRMDINGTFAIDLIRYPIHLIQTVEVQLKFQASDTLEKWFLKAYNWTSMSYSDAGFNTTVGHSPSEGWDYYAVNFTDKSRSYVRSDGVLLIKFHDERESAVQTETDIDFFGVRVLTSGVSFVFRNDGSLTAHVVSLWIISSNGHNHYSSNAFINSGENSTYILGGSELPDSPCHVKAVTERGNIAVYSPK
ncbi:MAG: hypothetical protein NWE81_00340 [Candidatus Bathyarchaeota archaeon]|nr:hypothetical protein [Candidatus Bathyarchaeota archaeon]